MSHSPSQPPEEAGFTEGYATLQYVAYISRVLQAAKEYAALGLPVFSLAYREKRPDSRSGWQERATTDPNMVDRAFSHDRPENLGIATGRGIVFVLDVDQDKGGFESLKRLEDEHGPLPETTVVQTGGGGRHYYFRVPPGTSVGNAVRVWPGLDIRGDGGLVVAPPSVHPDTGREYEWLKHPTHGIAQPPAWLLEALVARSKARRVGMDAGEAKKPTGRQRAIRRPHDEATKRRGKAGTKSWPKTRTARPGGESPVSGGQPVPSRAGDTRELLTDVVEHFPVPGFGHRHDMMCRAVGRLVGRGYADDIIVEVMTDWGAYFYAQGRVRTDGEGMQEELIACLRATRANSNFRPAHGESYHVAACAAIQLDDEQRRLLKSSIAALSSIVASRADPSDPADPSPPNGRRGSEDHPPYEPLPYPCKSVTNMRRLSNRLCESRDESWFAEVLVVIAIYKLDDKGEGTIRVTHDQIREIAALRFGEAMCGWDNQQLDRLKLKYVARRGTPAKVFELMREIHKGQPGRNGNPGTPSEYEATGIRALLKLKSRAGTMVLI